MATPIEAKHIRPADSYIGNVFPLSEFSSQSSKSQETSKPYEKEVTDFIHDFTPLEHNHMYQPIRSLQFEGEAPVFDISGRRDALPSWAAPEQIILTGHNGKIHAECYKPSFEREILQSPFLSIDIYPSISDWMKRYDPEMWSNYREVVREKPGFATPSTQLILPETHPVLADLSISIGMKAYQEDYGKPALGFWPPELAVDQPTLNRLSRHGVRFLILGKEQIESDFEAPIYALPTDTDQYMLVFPYDHYLTQDLADRSGSLWADSYARKIVSQTAAFSPSPFASVDMETRGHHHGKNSLAFSEYLFNTELPQQVQNGNIVVTRDISMIRRGKLKSGITSWSCPHDGKRWTARNGGCGCGDATGESNREKNMLFAALNAQIENIISGLDRVSSQRDYMWQSQYEAWYLDNRIPIAVGEPLSLSKVPEELRELFKQLTIAKMGWQSCAFFFNGDFERQMAKDCLRNLNERQEVQKAA